MKRRYRPARIYDEFTNLPLSRQRKYQLRQRKAGKCVKCGKPLCSAYYCLEHLISAREWLRKRTGAVERHDSLSYRLKSRRAGAKRRVATSAGLQS